MNSLFVEIENNYIVIHEEGVEIIAYFQCPNLDWQVASYQYLEINSLDNLLAMRSAAQA